MKALHLHRALIGARGARQCIGRSLALSPRHIGLCPAPIPNSRLEQVRFKSSKSPDLSELVVPLNVKISNNPDDINIGAELSGSSISKENLLNVLNTFYRRQPIRKLSETNGLDSKLFLQAFSSFRNHCISNPVLEPELHISISDIISGHGHVDDLFPFFLKHARLVFPHIECIEELVKISDLRLPPLWYPEARSIDRKIIFHSGPTNSGKTYHALKRFFQAKSGVYCGPLKLLAVEVNAKSNEAGTPCDLVTGEERTHANLDKSPASHTACTVEMVSTVNSCEVAVIDEIQMLRDPARGWAWTRALLGIPAKEIHLCGEEAALDVIKEMLMPIGEEVEVKRYKRLTTLTMAKEGLGSLDNVQPGDCIVCFSKADIYAVTLYLERKGHEVAVIYGGLPPSTKLAQARRFNDPKDSCKILVATDAIGMGLNLSIKRVIFYTITKISANQLGEKAVELLSTSQALQIGGRAGRFNTDFAEGTVTTFKREDLEDLKRIFATPVEPIAAAGIHPTADQIELFAYHLPEATLSNLIDIFVSLCRIDTSYYFMCNIEDFKFLADMIQHVPLSLRTRYVFCCAPINKNSTFVCTWFLRYAKKYSLNEPITVDWMCRNIHWPLPPPGKIADLVHLEQVFDVLDVYLWLSYRFPDIFPDQELVRDMQRELDQLIYSGVVKITRLLKALDSPVSEDGKESLDEKMSHELSFTDQLVSSGVLTSAMMEKLRKEWRSDKEDASKKKPAAPKTRKTKK